MYPLTKPLRVMYLDVGDGHRLYLEESGTAKGIPVIFLHGGPGAGCSPYHRCFFDPEKYRVILFDQRGAGKSTPHASLNANSTQHLIADLEKIRVALEIDEWMVFGGSWGSTLGLAYAELYPQRVLALVLRGIFLCRNQDIQWFYQHGAGRIFPDFWQDFIAPIPVEGQADLVTAYYQYLTGEDEVMRMRAAEAWSLWESRTAALQTNMSESNHFPNPHFALSLARIEAHYFVNHGFMRPNQLLDNAHKLKGIPGAIVHGRYDCICPIEQAFSLHEVWSEASLKVIPDAGHAATEPGISKALIDATDRFANSLS